jgi:hypothetical protein
VTLVTRSIAPKTGLNALLTHALKLLPRMAARISVRAKWDQIGQTDG